MSETSKRGQNTEEGKKGFQKTLNTTGKVAPTAQVVVKTQVVAKTQAEKDLGNQSYNTFLEHYKIDEDEKALHKYGVHTTAISKVLKKLKKLNDVQIELIIREWMAREPKKSLMNSVVEIVRELEPTLLIDPFGNGIWSIPDEEGFSQLLRTPDGKKVLQDPIHEAIREFVQDSISDPSMGSSWKRKALGNSIYYTCLAIIAKNKISHEDYESLTFATKKTIRED